MPDMPVTLTPDDVRHLRGLLAEAAAVDAPEVRALVCAQLCGYLAAVLDRD